MKILIVIVAWCSLNNLSDNDELIEVRRIAAIRKCGKNMSDDNVTGIGYNDDEENVAEHGEDIAEHGEM